MLTAALSIFHAVLSLFLTHKCAKKTHLSPPVLPRLMDGRSVADCWLSGLRGPRPWPLVLSCSVNQTAELGFFPSVLPLPRNGEIGPS